MVIGEMWGGVAGAKTEGKSKKNLSEKINKSNCQPRARGHPGTVSNRIECISIWQCPPRVETDASDRPKGTM